MRSTILAMVVALFGCGGSGGSNGGFGGSGGIKVSNGSGGGDVVVAGGSGGSTRAKVKDVKVGDAGGGCMLTVDGAVICWGTSRYVAQDSFVTFIKISNATKPAPGLESGAQAISVGTCASANCAIDANGGVLCWGGSPFGPILGDGMTMDSSVPIRVKGLESGAKSISVGCNQICAINMDGGAFCWGSNRGLGTGPVSINDPGFIPFPSQVVTGLNKDMSAIFTDIGNGYVIDIHGAVYFWGDYSESQPLSQTPQALAGYGSDVTDISLNGSGGGLNGLCILKSGAVYCGRPRETKQPYITGLDSGIVSVSTTSGFGCVVKIDGSVWCWGNNTSGQLGDGTTTTSMVPVKVVGLAKATKVSVSSDFACAVDDGDVHCWGKKEYF